MAEVLSVVASGISVGSLAIQLVDSLQKICHFWKSVQDAPKNVGDTIEELQVLAAILSNLLSRPERNEVPIPCDLVRQCFQHCNRVLDDLNFILTKLHHGFLGSKNQKQWTSIKSALRKDDIRDLHSRLERSKSTLSLAISFYKLSLQQQQISLQQQQTAFQQEQVQIRQEQTLFHQEQIAWQQQQTASMTLLLSLTDRDRLLNALPPPNETGTVESAQTISPTLSTSNKQKQTSLVAKRAWIGVGWYHYQAKVMGSRPSGPGSRDCGDNEEEITRSYFPASWLCSKGFSFGMTRVWGVWRYNLRPTRVVPQTAPIFHACRHGDIQRVVELFTNREATVYDTDESGRTTLHWAAAFYRSELSRWLIDHGVTGDGDHDGRIPLHYLVSAANKRYNSEAYHDTARVLIEQGQQDPMTTDNKGQSALHFYAGNLETLKYISEQQNHFLVDLYQTDNDGDSVVEGTMPSFIYRLPYHGLQVIQYISKTSSKTGQTPPENFPLMLWICQSLRLIMRNLDFKTQSEVPDVVEMDDFMDWLVAHIATLSRRNRYEYFIYLTAYDCGSLINEDPTDLIEANKTLLIRFWLLILRKANVSLTEHFYYLERRLKEGVIPDICYHRQGIKRVLQVGYERGSDQVDISIRDIRVERPLEECVPGAWRAVNTLYGWDHEAMGLEPTADWRVSSKEDCSVSSPPWE